MIGRSIALGTALAVCVAAGAAAETSVVPCQRDNTLYESASGDVSNGQGEAFYVGDNSQLNTRRGVVRFDVGGQLPAGSTVTGVELRLTVQSAPDSVVRTVTVHRVLADWGEGTSAGGGQGAPAQPGDATWWHRFYPDSTWSAPGGDFDITSLAFATVGEAGLVTWSGAALASEVQTWLDHPAGNFGWMLRGEEGQAQSARAFHSRESSDAAARPSLVVEWTAPPTAVRPSTWASAKAGYRTR